MRPPTWAERLLRLTLPAGIVRESVLGDLEEDFESTCARSSAREARRRYARQAVGVAFRYLIHRPVRTPRLGGGAQGVYAAGQAAHHAARGLRRAPGFAALVAATLALGVGATTAIFSVVDAVLLRPLPYPDANELVVLRVVLGDREMENHSEPEYWDLARDMGAFSAVAAYTGDDPILGGQPEPQRIDVVLATASLLTMLEVPPLLGRVFTDAEDVPGGERVLVLSHGLWTRAFAADPAVVGTTIQLENRPHTIVGVMPQGFAFPRPEAEAWAPLGLDRDEPWERNNHYLSVVARLDEGTRIEAAAAELDALGARSIELHPDFYSEPMSFRPYPLHESLVGDVRFALLLVLGAVAGVLLIAAINAAGLFLARGERRRDEIAVRTALGAGRARVAAQLLFESLLIALLGGAAGMGLAWAAVQGLERFAPPDLPRLEQVALDGRVLGFGLLITLVTGLLFGLVPAIEGWRADVRAALASGGRGGIGSRKGTRFRRALVVIQLAIATVLALGSGLLLRSLSALRDIELGFVPEGVLVVSISPAASSVAPDADAVDFYGRLEDGLAALPGVAAVGSALRVPLVEGHDGYSIRVEGAEAASIGEAPAAGMQWATHGFFEAMGISLQRGRAFAASDDAASPLVAVVSESLAAELWPGEEAVGRRLAMFGQSMPWMEVVGVVADVKHMGIQEPASAMLYIPHTQGYRSAYYSPNGMSLFVRADGDPSALAAPVRAAVNEAGPTIPISRIRTMSDIAGAALARERFTLVLIGLFSLVALALSSVGVYGVVAQTVTARTREIGLRMAVGADRQGVAAAVLREGLVLAALGLGLGLVAGIAMALALARALYGVAPLDPWALGGTAPVLALTAAAASLLPALRAARLDPVEALRDG